MYARDEARLDEEITRLIEQAQASTGSVARHANARSERITLQDFEDHQDRQQGRNSSRVKSSHASRAEMHIRDINAAESFRKSAAIKIQSVGRKYIACKRVNAIIKQRRFEMR